LINTLLLVAVQVTALSCQAPVQLNVGQVIPLETASAISSKTNIKGETIAARVAQDVRIDGRTIIAKGTLAVVQIADVRSTGGMGSSGRLIVTPLYVQVGGRTVRLSGVASKERGASAGQVVGMVFLGPIFSGRTAILPEGTRIDAMVSKAVTVPDCLPSPAR
jgi:hypothetical protein